MLQIYLKLFNSRHFMRYNLIAFNLTAEYESKKKRDCIT